MPASRRNFLKTCALGALCVATRSLRAGENSAPTIIQFHRGGGMAAPENTLETFVWAWENGGVPEADTRLTKDGVLVAFHDNDLSRLAPHLDDATKRRPIDSFTWDEMKLFDVGRYKGEAWRGQHIPTMESVFLAMQEKPARLLYIDEKGAPMPLVAEAASRFGVQNQCILASTRYECIKQWKALCPHSLTLHWMGGTEEQLRARFDALRKVEFAGVSQLQIHVTTGDLDSPDPFRPSSDFLRRAGRELKERGILFQALSWTKGNVAEVYYRLMDLGVESFATDHPLETVRACAQYREMKKSKNV
ncbi:MAG: glycerophosphodiester phosphodiesterase family protein [Planctomycetia bacterium]|nr:glycerophosphodiester phosphodiesterase family protein [Planctomycetia bacterium]